MSSPADGGAGRGGAGMLEVPVLESADVRLEPLD
ncbi:MAG: hypothetical protein QOC59_1883, partial [Microbacteriaceae bacterium]|nr:hypothetical protein [Microbacteriaceae bacterium]